MTKADADFVVLTALGVEHDAVRAHLEDVFTHTDSYGTRYLVGRVRGVAGRTALALIGEGNLAAAVLAARAIEEFRPALLLMVGVAGGLKDDAALGDVVVGTRVYAYHGGREESGGFRPRPRGWSMSHALDQLAREVASERRWSERIQGAAAGPPPTVHFKPIVSGEVVLDSRSSPLAVLIERHYGDALAIDMESAGVVEAAHRKDFHGVVVVRGVSDNTDGTKRAVDDKGWQPRASATAAAFAMALTERVAGRAPVRDEGIGPDKGLAAFREADARHHGRRGYARSGRAGRLLGRGWWQGLGAVVGVVALVVTLFQVMPDGGERSPTPPPSKATSQTPDRATPGSTESDRAAPGPASTPEPSTEASCVAEHFDKHPKVLDRYRWTLRIGRTYHNLVGGPARGLIFLRSDTTIGAMRIVEEGLPRELRVTEVVDASCAPVRSQRRKVSEDEWLVRFTLQGGQYELLVNDNGFGNIERAVLRQIG